MRYRITVEGRTFDIEVKPSGEVWVNQRPLSVDLEGVDGLPLYSLLVENRSFEAHVESDDEGETQVVLSGRPYKALLNGERQKISEPIPSTEVSGPERIAAPLPGRLVDVRVAEGDEVEEGDVIAVLESMKMHLELRTSQTGTVQSLSATTGHEVSQGDLLAVIDEVGKV